MSARLRRSGLVLVASLLLGGGCPSETSDDNRAGSDTGLDALGPDTLDAAGLDTRVEPPVEWTRPVDGWPSSAAVAANGTVIVADENGLWWFSPEGNLLNRQDFPSDHRDARVAASPSGGVVVARTYGDDDTYNHRLAVEAYSPEMTLSWSHRYETADFRFMSVAVAPDETVWLVGTAWGEQDFGLGVVSLHTAFVVAYDPKGQVRSSEAIHGSTGLASAIGATDAAGRLFVVGEYWYEPPSTGGPAFLVQKRTADSVEWEQEVLGDVIVGTSFKYLKGAAVTPDGGIAFTRRMYDMYVGTVMLDAGGQELWRAYVPGIGMAAGRDGGVWTVDGKGGSRGSLTIYAVSASGESTSWSFPGSGTPVAVALAGNNHLVLAGIGAGIEVGDGLGGPGFVTKLHTSRLAGPGSDAR